MRYTIHKDGSFDLYGTHISLLGCYPSLEERPLRPVGIEAEQDSVTYFLEQGSVRIVLRQDPEGRIQLDCSALGLAGVHDLEPLSGARAEGAAQVYVQGHGMEGPSGLFSLSETIPVSYGLSALSQQDGVVLVYAEDHRRYTAVFRTQSKHLLAGACTDFSAGFNLEGTADAEVELPALFLEEAAGLSTGLRTCAKRIAKCMGARNTMPPAFFWSSWYYLYETLNQQQLEEYLLGMKAVPEAGFRYIEIDAGYVPSLGDWLLPNHRWPGGLKQAAKTILDAGYQPGIWIGPFIVGDRSNLYREHPDWMLKGLDGKPLVQLQSYTEPKIWGNQDCNYYVLDASHPEALAYLEQVFRTMKQWGFSLFKTDFMFWNMHDTATVRRYDPTLTSVEILRRVLEVIRNAIGEDSYLLGCIAPFMPFIGYADGMRIAGDGGARWAEPFGPINLLRELPCDNYFNHVFWQNDTDAMLLRDFDTFLTEDEVESLALMQAMSGGAVNTSDPVHLLSAERKALLRMVTPNGKHTPRLPYLGTDRKELVMLHQMQQGNLLYVLNPTDDPLTFYCRLSELFGEKDWYLYRYDRTDGGCISVKSDVAADRLAFHHCALYFVTETPLAHKPENLWIWG